MLEPYSQRLWIIGGSYIWKDEESPYAYEQSGAMEYTSDMLVLCFNSATPLKLLAKESVIRFTHKSVMSLNAPKDNGLWKNLEIPEHLWSELETRKASFVEERLTGIKKIPIKKWFPR